jgi:uncharacterized cupin superfamily protein
MRLVNMFDPEAYDHGSMRHGYRWRGAHVGSQLKARLIGGTVYDILSDEERTFPYHFHHGMEEWLLVIDGTPTLRYIGGDWELKVGDLVCFPTGPQGGHQVRGPGTVLILSATRPLDAVEYPDSNKIGVRPPGTILRAGDELDYWEGEEISQESAEEPAP